MSEEGKLFTENYIVNGHGFHDEVMSMDGLDTLLFSGKEFSVKKQDKVVEDDFIDGDVSE